VIEVEPVKGTAGTTSASDHVAPVWSRPANGRSPRRIWRAIVYGSVPALFLGAFLATGVGRNFRGNWSALFYFGNRWADGAALPRNPIVREGAGYDGQFYYRVARDPLLPFARLRSHLLVAQVPGIDTPWYRYRRIAYPLAARFAAAGKPDALVWSFPVVSLLGIWLGVVSTWRLFESFGWRGYWGISYAFLPGLVFAATRNLCEGLALSVLSAALLAVARRRTPLAVGLLTIAHLAHETTALVSIGCFAHAAFARRRWRVAAVYLLPLGVVVIWSATVAVAFAANLGSVFSAAGGTGGLGLPLEGIWHKLLWLADPAHGSPAYSYLPTSRRFWRQEAALMPPIVLALFLLLREGWRRRTEIWPAGLAVSFFALTYSDRVWVDAASYARVTSLALLLALRSVAESPDRVGYAFLASLPLATWAALGSCADNWRNWPLVLQ
jgi:hypothetical protein